MSFIFDRVRSDLPGTFQEELRSLKRAVFGYCGALSHFVSIKNFVAADLKPGEALVPEGLNRKLAPMTVATGADTGVTFALEDEDHTLANSLRFLLNKKCGPPRQTKGLLHLPSPC